MMYRLLGVLGKIIVQQYSKDSKEYWAEQFVKYKKLALESGIEIIMTARQPRSLSRRTPFPEENRGIIFIDYITPIIGD